MVVGLVVILVVFGGIDKVQAAGVCYCEVLTKFDDQKIEDIDLAIFDDKSKFDRLCIEMPDLNNCVPRGVGVAPQFTTCEKLPSIEACSQRINDFDRNYENLKQIAIRAKKGTLPTGPATPVAGSGSGERPQGLLGKVLPSCVFDATVQGECKDVNIFIKLAIDLANVLISIIGGIALLAFVYGGGTMIISEGNAEKIEKGKGVLVAACIGLAVVLGGYLLVNVVSDALGVSSEFRLQ
jgi:hypothetical protein